MGSGELRDTHRYNHAWEAHALGELRRGEGAWLETRTEHGRVHGGTDTSARNECFARWWGAHQAGRDAVMLAQDHATADELAAKAHATRVLAGEVQARGGSV